MPRQALEDRRAQLQLEVLDRPGQGRQYHRKALGTLTDQGLATQQSARLMQERPLH
jgi:hypothetical protein